MKDQEKETSTKRFNKYIVCIGASAGGLEAIHDFFDHMPQSSSFSFVVIQHLSPDHKSLLVELVGKHTHMKVFEAERSEEHTSELQSRENLVCRLLLEK